jgi:hypothetical protein
MVFTNPDTLAGPAVGSPPRSPRVAQALSLLLFLAVVAAVPLGLRLVNRAAGTAHLPDSYLPSVVPPRQRAPFEGRAVAGFRDATPAMVLIGDSIAGSRIHHRYLMQISGEPVAPVFEPATGSVFWYLAFKNWVVASGIHPHVVVFFFRDENLTDPMFRLNPALLDRVAREREPEVDALLAAHAQGPLFRLHSLLRRLYQFDRTREWAEPRIATAPVALAAAPRYRHRLLSRMNEELFSLERLRPAAAADMAFGDRGKLDFSKNLPGSVLPAIIRTAKEAGIRPAFIRVQRRPENGRPPVQSEALQRYVGDLRRYLEANGAYFHDEWGDPNLPLWLYSDGDHVNAEHRLHTTQLFYERNRELFR